MFESVPEADPHRGLPTTFIIFSISPSHSDTKGTVNGFQTGSRVYLITCRGEHRMLSPWAHPQVQIRTKQGHISKSDPEAAPGGPGQASCLSPPLPP